MNASWIGVFLMDHPGLWTFTITPVFLLIPPDLSWLSWTTVK